MNSHSDGLDGSDPGHLSNRLGPRNQAGGVDLEAYPRTGSTPFQHTRQDGGCLNNPQPPSGEPKSAWREGAYAEGEVVDEREKELDELFGCVTRELDHSAAESGVTPAERSSGHVPSIAPVVGKSCCGKAELKSHVSPMGTLIKPPCAMGAKNCNQSKGIPSGDLLKELFSPPTHSVTPQRHVCSVRLQSSSMETPHRCTSSSTVTLTSVSTLQGTNCASLSATVTPPTVTPPMGAREVETKSLLWTTPSSTTLGGMARGGNPTPPLCKCGRRAKRQTVSAPGPNDGRHFFACPLGKTCSSKGGCGFFVWVDSSSTRVVTSPDIFGSEYDDV